MRYYVLNILVRTESQRGPMCFRCLIFSLSGPCECNVVSLYVLCCHVNGSVCFVCCVFDSVSELLDEVGVFVIVCGWRCSIA